MVHLEYGGMVVLHSRFEDDNCFSAPGWWMKPHSESIPDDRSHCFRPATYSDLNREPVEGERAVRVDGGGNHYNEQYVGTVYTFDGEAFQAEGLRTHSAVEKLAALFAPLTPVPSERGEFPEMDAELKAEADRLCGDHRPKALGTEPTPPPAVPVECEKGGPYGFASTCDIMWLSWDVPCDPCQPCATLIDIAEANLAWYAEGRCEHGWKSKCKRCAGDVL